MTEQDEVKQGLKLFSDIEGFLLDLEGDIKQYGLTEDIKTSAIAVLFQIFKDNGYVQLAEDQTTLPELNLDNYTAIRMFKAGWRRIEL